MASLIERPDGQHGPVPETDQIVGSFTAPQSSRSGLYSYCPNCLSYLRLACLRPSHPERCNTSATSLRFRFCARRRKQKVNQKQKSKLVFRNVNSLHFCPSLIFHDEKQPRWSLKIARCLRLLVMLQLCANVHSCPELL